MRVGDDCLQSGTIGVQSPQQLHWKEKTLSNSRENRELVSEEWTENCFMERTNAPCVYPSVRIR